MKRYSVIGGTIRTFGMLGTLLMTPVSIIFMIGMALGVVIPEYSTELAFPTMMFATIIPPIMWVIGSFWENYVTSDKDEWANYKRLRCKLGFHKYKQGATNPLGTYKCEYCKHIAISGSDKWFRECVLKLKVE